MGTESSPISPMEKTALATILLTITVMVVVDISSDTKEGAGFSHIAVELFIAVIALVGYLVVMRKSQKSTATLKLTNEQLAKSQTEALFWKQNSKTFIDGLGQAIEKQFKVWKLSNSETEIAFMMLKGLSLKEIAELRHTSEKTTRTQATAIYQKSGLAGRTELSAFFLEDLLTVKRTFNGPT